ncbi:hypothetical protein GGR92_004282 [Spirosoma lacussanchae]|uniref:HmuY family protein n=1 Tax=Spirosoma lacussanchae TaxID=1884249 RepID=UPI001108F084|nr:HmuY family protein [Spirosoma lacussanchae]
MKTTYPVLLLVAAMSMLQACNDDDTSTAPVLPVQAQTVTNLPADPTTPSSTTGQPPLSTGKYTLFNLRDNKTVVNTDSASNKWDIGFRGTSIIVNGGPIRSGQGGAYVYTGTFDELTTIPTSATFAQDQSPSSLAIPSVSGAGWYNYNSTTNLVTPIPGRVLVIRTGDNKYAKVEILSYYENAPAAPTSANRSRFYTFRYLYQPNGSMKLN